MPYHQNYDGMILLAMAIIAFSFFTVVLMIIYGVREMNKSSSKHRKRKRMEIRRREKKIASYRQQPTSKKHAMPAEEICYERELFDDWQVFERAIGCERSRRERFKVVVVQIPCGNDLAKGERTLRTKPIYFGTRPYRTPKHSRYDHATGQFIDYYC